MTQDIDMDAEPFDLTEEENQELVESTETLAPLAYSGQDFDVAGLVRRLNQEDILVPTFGHTDERIISAGFQRSLVWSRPQMDRFIESLLLGYPIPGIFLVRQPDRRYLVIDGQQRLRTLQFFYRGRDGNGKPFKLNSVGERLKGLAYEDLEDGDRRLLDDAFIQATIVPSDGSSASLEAVYQIFERLNAGGTQLTPHEIRVALYAGPLIDYLDRLNGIDPWRSLYGKRSPRIRDQEVILRILALYTNHMNYRRPLKKFLNSFAAQHRHLDTLQTTPIEETFKATASLLNDAVGRAGLRPRGYQLNAALTEALFVGLMRRLDHGTDVDAASVTSAVQDIRSDEALESAITTSTADEENVRKRLEIATARFARI